MIDRTHCDLCEEQERKITPKHVMKFQNPMDKEKIPKVYHIKAHTKKKNGSQNGMRFLNGSTGNQKPS